MNQSSANHSIIAPRSITGRRLTIVLYVIVAFLNWVSLFIYVPTLPTYIQGKTHSLALVGVVLSMYGLWQGLIRVPLGIVTDWLGWRKPFIITGLALAAGGAWMMGGADEASHLIVGRALTGLAAGAWVPLIVAFSSLFPLEEAVRATTWLTLANSMGRVLATSVTGSLNEWRGPSFTFMLAAVIAGLAILLVLPAHEQRRPTQLPSAGHIGQLIIRRDVLLPSLLAALLQYMNWSTTYGFNPILARQLGGTDVIQSMLVSMSIGIVVFGNLTTAVIVKRIGAQRLVYISFGILSMGIGLAALAPSLPVLFAAQFFIGLAEGTIYPLLMGLSIQYVVDTERTTAMGLHQATYAIGTFAGPWLSGLLAEAIGLRPMYGVIAFTCFTLSLFVGSRLTEGQ